jgi:hypothetical protein
VQDNVIMRKASLAIVVLSLCALCAAQTDKKLTVDQH